MKPFPVAVIESVLASGVQEFVVCAGARNSALIVVLAALGDKVRLWQHFDERAAGFFAIGRIRATERPVAVVTTSGTAAAELLPAVIEAHYQLAKLVVITADRPRSYRGSGAPQSIEQKDLFGIYPALSLDLENEPVDISPWCRETKVITKPDSRKPWDRPAPEITPGPLHLNVCLEEPDAKDCVDLRSEGAAIELPVTCDSCELGFPWWMENIPRATRLVLVSDTQNKWVISSAAARYALRPEAIIYAEASSGIRDEPRLQSRLIRCGDATIRHLPLAHVIRMGGVPSLRYWRDLEKRPDVRVSWIFPWPYPGLAREENLDLFGSKRNELCGEELDAAPFLARDAALYAHLADLLTQFPTSEPALFRRLSQIIPQNAAVLTGNSLAIREWNLCAEYGRGHRVHVLRGANGIDGNLSAFLGIAADEPEAWCVTGDLTALYDLNAPWMLRQLPAGRRRFVVIQNDGGKIFSRLPSLRGLNERERALMENPHNISLRGWAEMWGMGHVSGGGKILDRADSLPDHAVIELHPDAAQTEEFWQAWARAEAEVWGDL